MRYTDIIAQCILRAGLALAYFLRAACPYGQEGRREQKGLGSRRLLEFDFFSYGFRLIVQTVKGGHHVAILRLSVFIRKLIEIITRDGYDV